MLDKAEMRRSMRARLRSLSPGCRAAGSAVAAATLLALPECAEAELLLVFLSMPGEIDTGPLIEAALLAGKRVAAPRIEGEALAFVPLSADWKHWPRDRYGIPEPPAAARALSLAELGAARTLVVAPGLAFDPAGRRLGRGKGFYDRFLRAARAAAASRGGRLVVCGYALPEQLVDEVPAGPEDETVELVVAGANLVRPCCCKERI